MDYSLPGSSIHGIFQVRVLEWVAIAFWEARILAKYLLQKTEDIPKFLCFWMILGS